MNPSQTKRGGGCCLSSETWDPAFSGMAVFVVGGAPLNDWPGGLGRGPDHRFAKELDNAPLPCPPPLQGLRSLAASLWQHIVYAPFDVSAQAGRGQTDQPPMTPVTVLPPPSA